MEKWKLIVLMLVCLSCHSQKNYIDQNQPAGEPQLFAEEFVSKDDISEFGSVFNKRCDEFYFATDVGGLSKIWMTQRMKGKWSEPKKIIEHNNYSFNDPFLDPEENRLYYISDMPKDSTDTTGDYDIWYSERVGMNWSIPINAGSKINTDANEYYISFASDGAMYFASNKNKSKKRQHDYDIYKSNFVDNEYQTPEKLSDSINTSRYEADVFIDPNESYIIFCSARRDGFGHGDLYISFKSKNNEWTKAINMGPKINSANHELCPFVTQDGKFLLYTSNQNIYWVSAEIINKLRENE